jgi:endonuclease/exonuclease/phosphatase family metal-dependent hydrolase
MMSKSLVVVFLLASFIACSQNKKMKTPTEYTIGFYNMENLFDTEDDPKIDDSEYLPTSVKKWDTQRYQAKLTKISEVISQLGSPFAPDIMGLCELENKKVLQDLIAMPTLISKKYEIVHYDSPDTRGIDVALLYKPALFKPYQTKPYYIEFPNYPNDKTRNFLLVSGILASGDTLHVIVAHLPSRRSGDESVQKRMYVASQMRKVVVEILSKNENANIVMMGDWNDEPSDKSISEGLNAKADYTKLQKDDFYNPMAQLQADGKATHYYKSKGQEDNHLFDQFAISMNLVNKNSRLQYLINSASIFSPLFVQQTGNYAGFPNRTYVGDRYLGGYSDHFAVYLKLKVKK